MTIREKKFRKLEARLKSLGSALVAFSGGVDSTLLLKVATGVLGEKVLAVTASSATLPPEELKQARRIARLIGARHRVIRTRELSDPFFRRNPADRCYYCKGELFRRLKSLAAAQGLQGVVDGSNADDLSDYRPGSRAKKEAGVVSPLQEAGLTKKEIRAISREMGLPTWDKPALACLASRVPYGSPITDKRLRRIAAAERLVRERFGIKGNLRVRDLGDEARIEVDKKEIRLISASAGLKKLGYKRVTVDRRGYRTGSLNEKIKRLNENLREWHANGRE